MANAGQQTGATPSKGGGGELDDLRSDLAGLRAEVAGVVQAIKALGDSAVATAKRQQAATVERLSAEARSLADDAASAGREQVAELEARIRAQPLAAVGIAFAVGLLFGSLRR